MPAERINGMPPLTAETDVLSRIAFLQSQISRLAQQVAELAPAPPPEPPDLSAYVQTDDRRLKDARRPLRHGEIAHAGYIGEERNIKFDTAAGHDHDGTDSKLISVPAAFQCSDLSACSIASLGTKDHDLLGGLADDDHPQYLNLTKTGQTLTENLSVASGKTIDGVDISALLPTGIIAMWHGLIANIPSGWLLCDGSSGTPDLRDKFVKGAAAGAEAGTTGGSATHTHTAHAALAHAGSAVAHHEASTTGTNSTDALRGVGTQTVAASGHTHSTPTLTHSVTQPDNHAAQSHSTENSEPAYYTVLFIMKS